MNQKTLVGIIVVLAAAIIIIGIAWYQDKQSTRVEINLGEEGLSISAD